MAILDHGGVTKLIAQPSGRSAFQVRGNPRSSAFHICLPHHYCPCQSFFYDAVSRGEQLMCKHLLATRLAESLKCYNVAHVSDGALCLALSQM
ncbi:unnamed protein product [Closterium sp. Yama58-4]|nr:unnamed protein product [Closterium sp. Yama58-4]